MYSVNAAETHETFHWESGMRYQSRPHRPDSRSNWGFSVSVESAVPLLVPFRLNDVHLGMGDPRLGKRFRSGQMMRREPLRTWASELVAGQPVPPRHVPLWPLLRLQYLRESSRYLLVLGLVGAAAFVAASLAPGDSLWRAIGQIASAGFVGWTVIRPAFLALQLRRWLTSGRRVTATVVDVAFVPARDAGDSVEALRNGMATGHWRIDDGSGHISTASFATDAPWASVLREGSVVELLVDHGQSTWELGLVEGQR
jgi:hypothetical protein